jgi:surface protein
MIGMFVRCVSIQEIPLFDTSSVTTFSLIFDNCTSLQSVPLFDTSSVTNMATMFRDCTSLQSVPLFDTSSVTTMANMFQNCSSLQSVPLFDTSLVTIMTNFALNCFSMSKTDIVCPVSVGFQNCQLSQAELVNIFNNLVDRSATTAANINITGNWGASALTTAERDIALDKNWTITG